MVPTHGGGKRQAWSEKQPIYSKMIVAQASFLTRTGELSDMEAVIEFVYLGSLLSGVGDCENQINRRIELGKVAMTQSSLTC